MNTRRYPRTMTGTDAAFPKDPAYIASITHYRKPRNGDGDMAVMLTCLLCLVFLVLLLVVEAL